MKNHPFNNEANQLNILATGSRLTVINWLCWNDDNGIFSDDDCVNEDIPVLTLQTAVELMGNILTDNNDDPVFVNAAKNRFNQKV
jgi:hypothetical protein